MKNYENETSLNTIHRTYFTRPFNPQNELEDPYQPHCLQLVLCTTG